MRAPGRRKILCNSEVEKCMARSRSCKWARVARRAKGSRDGYGRATEVSRSQGSRVIATTGVVRLIRKTAEGIEMTA